MPTSLVHPEMVYRTKKYEAYCLKVSESGLRPKIDLRPGAEVPVYPEDGVDADPCFNKYPAQEEFVEGPDWVPGQIPPKIRSPEYIGSSSDTSSDMQAARTIEAMSVTTSPELDEVAASTPVMGDTHRVELTPLPGLSQQFMIQMEREIQKQIQEQGWKLVQEVLTPLPGLSQQFTIQMEREIQKQIREQSRKLVQEVLTQSANRVMPLPSLEAARASLCQCFQTALAAPGQTSAPPPQSERRSGEPAQYSLADLFARINPPPPEILKESCPESQFSRGRTATRSEPPKASYPPDEKKRRSNSHPRGEAELMRACSSGAEPSWNLSHIGGRHSDKAPSQPAKEPEAPETTTKLRSVVKKVRLDKAKPPNLKDLGPAARSRYDTTGQDRA